MRISRRKFMQIAAMAGGATMLPMPMRWLGTRNAYAFSNSIALSKFSQAMRTFGVDIPVAVSNGAYTNMDDYTVIAGTFKDQLHPSLTNPTRLYGYGASLTAGGELANAKHLGHAIIATKGRPARLRLSSSLPAKHIIPFDSSIPMPQTGLRQDRAAVHLHGGLVPWASDGGPFHWFSNPANNAAGLPTIGPSQVQWLPDMNGALTDDYFYPNFQSSRFMWYHDHAIGTTRTSAYAGLASGYVIFDANDPVEMQLATAGYSPTELLMVFQDKIFWDPAKDPGYATYITGAVAGDLWYPYLYERALWKINGPGKNLPIPSAIPEFFGDTMLVNGLVYPYKAVNQGSYRMRTLNACNARFLNLSFVTEDPNNPGEPLGGYLAPTPAPVDAWIIGTEGGFLPSPVQIFSKGLPLAAFVPTPFKPGPWLNGPAERYELIVDFSKCMFGQKVLLYNDAQAPFPAGAPNNDYYPGAPKNPVITAAGMGPNSRTLMRFDVSLIGNGIPVTLPANSAMQASNPVLPTVADPVNGGLKLNIAGSTYTHNGVQYNVIPTTQELTLNEVFDVFGRLQQLVGTNVPLVKGTFGRAYLDAPTETIQYKSIQIWNIYNLTADTHPMHVHEFNAMILRRRPFQVSSFNGIPNWKGPGRGPDPEESGWKETFRMNPGECTTIAILVEDPLPGRTATVQADGNTYTGTLPYSPRLKTSYNIVGDEYVWHCHILEHEEHDMMRPLVVI
jgi:spore coat protein A